ncbi:eukaryotic translation initiation factor 5, partial [Cryomyces antarcticus]
IKNNDITLDCKACGQRSTVDARLKLSGFILKNQPKKGKKDKSTKKADRKARKEAEQNGDGEDANGNGTPGDSNSDQADENGDVELGAGSDDELTRRINADAKAFEEPEDIKEVE